jgi:hypothetical protein
MRIGVGADAPDLLRMVAASASFGFFVAALVLATMIGTRDVFPGRARWRARVWLIVLLALALILLDLSSKPEPDFGSLSPRIPWQVKPRPELS